MERVSRIKTGTIRPPETTMMSGVDATRLAAWLRTRSILSAGQRSSTWILPPSVRPSFANSCLNASNTGFALAITLGERHYDSDAPHPLGLLRARRERPSSRRSRNCC
jgi:hypothetical protein